MTARKNQWPEDNFQDWIGRRTTAEEVVTPELVDRFIKTLPLASLPRRHSGIPFCLHWCLAPVVEPAEKLGPDGHPRLGVHLPPIPLSRRMWAGGSLEFHDPLQIGDKVLRVSTIRKIERKRGRSGALAFVTVRHEFETPRGKAVSENQDLVYRDPSGNPANSATGTAVRDHDVSEQLTIETDPVLLFRYSALTFNGHRIHYDYPYATSVEGYAGLVVHGPLMATMLANLAASRIGDISSFQFRGRSPLICGEKLVLSCTAEEPGVKLEARNDDGRLVMTAEAK